MSEHKAIGTDKAPGALGPYSQAIEAGNMLYISGQLGIDPATGKLVDGGAAPQVKQALENVMAILLKANMSMRDVVQVQVFLADIADFAAVNEIYKQYFSEPYPARAAVQVAALPAGAAVEILVTAVRN